MQTATSRREPASARRRPESVISRHIAAVHTGRDSESVGMAMVAHQVPGRQANVCGCVTLCGLHSLGCFVFAELLCRYVLNVCFAGLHNSGCSGLCGIAQIELSECSGHWQELLSTKGALTTSMLCASSQVRRDLGDVGQVLFLPSGFVSRSRSVC